MLELVWTGSYDPEESEGAYYATPSKDISACVSTSPEDDGMWYATVWLCGRNVALENNEGDGYKSSGRAKRAACLYLTKLCTSLGEIYGK